jgi:hypothetical protein
MAGSKKYKSVTINIYKNKTFIVQSTDLGRTGSIDGLRYRSFIFNPTLFGISNGWTVDKRWWSSCCQENEDGKTIPLRFWQFVVTRLN